MHKATYALLVLVAVILVPTTVVIGQTSTRTPAASPEQPFAAIDASLVDAVNSAIETASAPLSVTDPLAHPPQSQTLSAPVVSPRKDPQRIDPLRPIVQPILAREGVPNQLAAVIRVESGGNPMALSSKGARGLWQLMPDTARRYGLRVDGRLDERLDIEKATTGAARYLRDLYVQFGSWPLALAAYNTGEVNLQRAIDRARSRDFSTLSVLGYLPLETRKYVPAVLAAMGSQFPSVVLSRQDARPARFVYATSEESGQ